MDLKNFKRIAEDKDSYTVEHPSGKRLFIEKAKLSDSAHKKIQCMAQGGEIDGPPAPSTDWRDRANTFLQNPSQWLDQVNAALPGSGGQDALALKQWKESTGQGAGPNDQIPSDSLDAIPSIAADRLAQSAGPAVPFPNKIASQVPEADEYVPARPNGFTRTSPMLNSKDQAAIDAIRAEEGPVSGDNDYTGNAEGRGPTAIPTSNDPLIQEKLGQQGLLQEQIRQQQEALGAGQAAGKEVADVQQGGADALAKLPAYNDIVSKYQAKDQKLAQDYADAKIDPDHFIHSMSTGSKILTGIGMVLSGMGAATTGQPSYAMQVINDAIKRDVDAQQNDQSKKMNLWKMNREAMGNDTAANLATENQIKAGVLAKLQAAQTRAVLPQEKLRSQQAIDQLKQEMLQNNLRRGLLTQGSQGANPGNGLSNTDPAYLVPEMVKDPNQQKAVYEEIKNRANISKNGVAMLKAFDQAANEVSGAGGVIHSAIEKTPGQLALDQLMKPNMSELDGTIRHEAVAGAQETMIPSFKDLGRPDRIASKRQSLIDWMKSQQSAPVSKGNMIDLDRFQSTAIPNGMGPSPQGKQMPQGPQTQVMHGHAYQKVQGGWKLVK